MCLGQALNLYVALGKWLLPSQGLHVPARKEKTTSQNLPKVLDKVNGLQRSGQ